MVIACFSIFESDMFCRLTASMVAAILLRSSCLDIGLVTPSRGWNRPSFSTAYLSAAMVAVARGRGRTELLLGFPAKISKVVATRDVIVVWVRSGQASLFRTYSRR